MNTWTRNAAMTLLAAVLLALVAVGWGYRTLWARYDKALLQLESRSERLDGLVNAGPDIESLLATVRNSVTPWMHPGGENAQNDIQQQLRELIVNSGVTLVSSQAAMEPAANGKLASIRLTATVTGDWVKMVRLSEALQNHQPPFWVRTVSINREGAGTSTGAQNARLTLQLDASLSPEKGQP